MYTKRNIFILGETHECEEVVSFLKRYFESAKKSFQYSVSHDYDELYEQMVDTDPSLVIVLADGANGMECVYQAKKYDRNMTVFWFSDDCNFSIHSHRLDCAYFAKKPLTFEMLDKAFYRCKSLGIFI